ncbi:dna polymerase iii subunits gamma and tau [Fusarium austroafricanum]|uniref:Dna polymerase iii subunits gamma and tau n=1 Tax=Fusarium austroafricanum TaxID=2364996 RepID=A0A8H4NTT5_9HYPO|nr:dna polymerase iii subunits gamma and tau [Fusarium austroafricanum]
MFAVQHPGMDQRKRAREEELANAGGFGEHRNKRIQCLPLRASPRTTQWQNDSHMHPPSYAPHDHLQGCSDVDMMQTSQLQLQQHQEPGRFGLMQPESDNVNGRMPTPIQPSFAAQVRGQQAVTIPNGVANLGHQITGFGDDQSVPRTMAGGWQAIPNERRLPSPISECDDSMACQPITPTGMQFDASVHGYVTPGMEHPNVRVEPSPPHDTEHPMMDVESHSADGDGDPTTPSPRRGHIRSRHTVNNWTWQPGMKKSFSIGYRADCEKCRLKVPGHFNHIIVS